MAGAVAGTGLFVACVSNRVEEPTRAAAAPPTSTLPAPTTTVVATTPPPATTTQPFEPIVIHGVGDTNFDPEYVTTFRTESYDYAFAGLDGLFLHDDLTVVNLECSPSDLGSPFDKEFIFRCDPASLPVAHSNGVDVVNLANNHGQDFGTEAMLDGRRNALSAGLLPVGVGENLAEATSPAVIEVRGVRIAVLGFGGVHPSSSWLATADSPGMADGDDLAQMVAAVEAAAGVADHVVVTIHWGRELVIEPLAFDREAAEAMIAAGADVIFGHHPHRLGAMELIEGKPVFWTLGNFIWPRLSDAGATTAVARVVIAEDGSLVSCLIPAFIETSGQPVLQAEPMCEGEK